MKEWIKKIVGNEEALLPYMVGALLYSPANNETVAQSVIDEKFGQQYSLALCLEDSISDRAVERAETVLIQSINKIKQAAEEKTFFLPHIFIRVRNAEQIQRLYEAAGAAKKMVTGFIFPKFSADNAQCYITPIRRLNEKSSRIIYMMPILESVDIVNIHTRYETLRAIREQLEPVKKYVLNIRVGGNDICRSFGIRRHCDETIYEIGAVANILSDIITYFSMDYVVSGPVWEYFGGKNGEWRRGMQREIQKDKVNGFIGKTVIHPNQIAVVNEALSVHPDDYDDAISILKLAENDTLFVEKSIAGERMNEYKTHIVWAKKMLILAEIYGVSEEWNRR